MKLAIIPARGGSKRVPGKNLREFCGKPMIAWPIEAAQTSGCFDRIVVSTDDEQIAETARLAGADVPFLRPPELSGDDVPTRPVVNHAINVITSASEKPELVCCIYATAPFLTAAMLREAEHLLVSSDADFAFSCGAYGHPIQRAFRMTQGGGAERFWPEHRLTRSQDLDVAYHDAGQFYWGRTEAFLRNQDAISSASRPYVLPRHLLHDIDTEEDWARAELVFRALMNAEGAGR